MSQGRPEKFERDCDAALGWIARFRSDTVSEADRQAFALWLGEDPDHGRAMDRMQDLWDDLGSLKHLPEHELPASTGRRRWLGASVALAASLLLALLLLPQLNAPVPGQHYQTALGERRSVTLADGSRITLNTRSAIEVRLGEERRRVNLLRGEAYFEVATDRSRPFEVDAGPARVTVVGTAFNIYRRDANHSDITVAEGVVRVTESDAPSTRPAASEILRANQQLRASRRGFAPSTRVDPAPQLAWQRGELLAREMTLAELVAEMQRYSDQRIIIADPRVARETVSGVFKVDHPASILAALQHSLGIQVVEVDDGTVQLLRGPQ